MTLPALVSASQLLSAMAWLFVMFHYLPSLARVVRNAFMSTLDWVCVQNHFAPAWPRIARNTQLSWDGAGCWAALSGLLQTGFMLRWLAMPNNNDIEAMSRESLIVWIALYILNAACGVGILHTWRDQDYEASKRRARWAVMAWFVLAAACVGAASWVL